MIGGTEVGEIGNEELAQIVETLERCVTPARRDRIRDVLAARTRDVILVLEHLRNPHNGAAVFRTAEAFGFFEVHVVPAEGPLDVSPRVSSGSHKWLEVHTHSVIDDAYGELEARGYRIYASSLHGDAIPLSELDVRTPIALVLGNERDGLSTAAVESAHGRFRIPMWGFVESFNISVAAAVCSYDVATRRRQLGLAPKLRDRDRAELHAVYLAKAMDSARAILARAGLPYPIVEDDGFRMEGELE